MRIIRKIETIEAKRTFVISDHIAHIHKGKKLGNNRTFLKDLSESQFNQKLKDVKERVLKLREEELDKLVSPEWPKRLKAYNESKWYIAEVDIREVGVWRRAGNLPLRWTNKSLAETALKVSRGLKRNSKSIKRRPKHAIPNILKMSSHVEQKEKYLYPIVFKGGTGTRGRKRLKQKMMGDIEDGNMRSIALAISGKKKIIVYFGVPL